MARLWLIALLVAGCRTELLDPQASTSANDAAMSAPQPTADFSAPDLLAADLASPPDGDICSKENFNGYCPEHFTCCPYGCWGGNDVSGWCAPTEGCPVC